MARAKRTDRAEARRRYRAAAATDGAVATEDSAEPGTATSTARRSSAPPSGASRPTGTPPRMGMAAAFRASIRPVNVREDIASLPWIALHTKALWIPLLITVVATVAVLVTGGQDAISAFLFAYFVQTPAIGGVFIAGFLAPRASWLLGVIVGFVAAIGYSIFIVVSTARGITPAPAPGAAQDAIVAAFVLSPILGAFFAASAAWYRRFLSFSNPNRNQSKSAQPKRGDGKTRTSGTSQKAAAKR